MIVAGPVMDSHMRIKKRDAVVKALLDGGLAVHCFGMEWEPSGLCAHPNFLYHGPVGYEAVHELYRHTKIALNTLPIYVTDSHERVFSSMMCGALCVSDYTRYLGEHFADGRDIVYFDYKDPAGLVQKVRHYLEHDEERIRITKAAFAKVRGGHTWLHRAADLLDIFESYRPQ
jgi:spore maturation protein CgeB